MVDDTCVDPDYNAATFVTDSTEQKELKLPDGGTIAYREVRGHFPAIRTKAQLPVGIGESPTTAKHAVVWRFPEQKYWRNRFFQQTYPLGIEMLNTVDPRFAFTNGGYTVGVNPGSPNVGYRVPAAAAKLAKAYANKLYGNAKPVFGYLFGMSGGSVQSLGATEGTSGVWAGVIPIVIATDGLQTHSFQLASLYATAIPEAKRKAIAAAAAPGSGVDLHAGLTDAESAVLDELLRAGFARRALEDMRFSVGSGAGSVGAIQTFDPTYENDFWTRYEGANPPAWLTAAQVDGVATIASIKRSAENAPMAIVFDPASLPRMGSVGAEGAQFLVLDAKGQPVVSGDTRSLAGKFQDNTFTLNTPGDPFSAANDPVLLAALKEGGRIRITNRGLLAALFYPRHTILDNGNPAYDQYKNRDGSPKYEQRPVSIAYSGNLRAAGGIRQTGKVLNKTIVLEILSIRLLSLYRRVLCGAGAPLARAVQTDRMFRLYYQDYAAHGAFPANPPGRTDTTLAAVGAFQPGPARPRRLGREGDRAAALDQPPARRMEPGGTARRGEPAVRPATGCPPKRREKGPCRSGGR